MVAQEAAAVAEFTVDDKVPKGMELFWYYGVDYCECKCNAFTLAIA